MNDTASTLDASTIASATPLDAATSAHAAASVAPPERLTAEAATGAETQEISVDAIRVDPSFNPRKAFDDADIAAFAERIRTSGWLSPPLVRPDPYGEGFLLVAGERRLRAIRHLGWLTVQVTVKAMSDTEHRQLALAENIDRKDLTIAEETLASRDYLAAYEGDHDAAAGALGWPVARLRHRLKLLHASPSVLDALMNGTIQLGHAELLATLPVDNQDKALPRLIADGMTVAALREQINGFVSPLASAIFDTAGCANCVFNTSCQGTLFEARVAEGNCTNKPCFRQKTEDALEAKRLDLKSDFGTVVLISERAAEQWTPLVKHGENGVGTAQFDACRTCEFRGAAIHDAPGARLGTVESPLCFNTSCHAQHVATYKAEVEESQASSADAGESAAAPTPGKTATTTTIKAKPKPKGKPKAQAVIRSVGEQYGQIVGRAGLEAMGCSRAYGLALAVYALIRIASDESTANVPAILESLRLPKLGGSMSDTAKVALLATERPERLDCAIQELSARILTTDVNNRPFSGRLNRRALLPRLAQASDVVMAKHVVIDEAFLAAHTKPAIEAVLDESGFKAWMLAQDDGEKRYRALVACKKDDLIAGVLKAGYTFDGYVPSGLDAQVAAWGKEAQLPKAPPTETADAAEAAA